MNKVAYRNPQQINRELDKANLDKWFTAYEDMWRLIKAGYSQTEVISHLSNEWEDGEVGRFLQWVRFYESEDDRRYAFDMNSSFIKVAVSMPGISLRNFSIQEMVAEYKKKMFSRLKSLRSLLEESIFKLPDDLVMDHDQAQRAVRLIGELSEIIRRLKIDRATTPEQVVARVKLIEDNLCKLGMVINAKKNPLMKIAESANKQDILELLQSAHKSFVEKPSVRELALAFAKDTLGQFPDIGQALAKMIEAHNYVTPRIEEIMSNISVQLGSESMAREPEERLEPELAATAPTVEVEDQDIQVKMPESASLPRATER